MTREFIITPEFDKKWTELGFNDDDLMRLQIEILMNPKTGIVIQGTGGLRKVRFAINKGKSGGVRVYYVDLLIFEEVYLLTVQAKKHQENLTSKEKDSLKKLVEQLKQEAYKRRYSRELQ